MTFCFVVRFRARSHCLFLGLFACLFFVLSACVSACLFFSLVMMVLIVLVSIIYVLLLRDGFDCFATTQSSFEKCCKNGQR